MARALLSDVRAILTDDIELTDNELNVFLTTATTLVDAELVGSGLPDALLKEIEKYLAAHFASLKGIRAGVSNQRVDDASETYTVAGANIRSLQGTHFGQAAIALDTSGRLAQLGRTQASFMVL